MLKFRYILLFVALSGAANFAHSQNNTNSPYTRFGFGQLSDNASGSRRALGGASIGYRSPRDINTVNPASYSAVDTLSFMFDIGVSGLYSRFSDMQNRHSTFTGNLEYITMQLPVSKHFGVSAGFQPYSYSGYYFGTTGTVQVDPLLPSDTTTENKIYSGSGTISQIYVGLAYKFLNHFSVGANFYYMFGDISNYRSAIYGSYKTIPQQNNISVSNVRFRYGFQYFTKINQK